jgi:hypothetical protein
MKTILLAGMLIAGSGLGFGLTLKTQEQEQQPLIEKRAFMQQKVEHAKQIVEALALENYESIAKNAQDLMLISNESRWNAYQTPEYIEMSKEFRVAAERLREASREKNIDSATLSYFEMTLSCVRCHKYLRQKKRQ